MQILSPKGSELVIVPDICWKPEPESSQGTELFSEKDGLDPAGSSSLDTG